MAVAPVFMPIATYNMYLLFPDVGPGIDAAVAIHGTETVAEAVPPVPWVQKVHTISSIATLALVVPLTQGSTFKFGAVFFGKLKPWCHVA